MANILVTDDNEAIRNALKDFLEKDQHQIALAESGEKAVELLQDNIFDVAIVDLIMEEIDGMAVLKAIKDISPETEVIMITGHGTISIAIQAMRSGAYDFITKPPNFDELKLLIDRALEKREITIGMKVLQTHARERQKFSSLIGSTPAIYKVFALIEKVCRFDTTVLITGETGTGKDLVARTIHANSPRCNNPFVSINCSSTPESLQESEFFGHIKGAFTDANENKKGLFESAHKGTIFLDEIGDASLATQLKLLRFLEDGEIRRVGENTSIHIDVRLITATNKNLLKAIEEKEFREDLYYRIHVVEINIPPLRERKDDIPLLAEHFLRTYSGRLGKKINNISQQALALLMQYDWPGNVRELQSVIRHTVAFTDKDTIVPESFPDEILNIDNKKQSDEKKQMSLQEIEKAYMIQMLENFSWNYSQASKIMGISRATIYRKIKEYGLSPKDDNSDSSMIL
jgi:DNA-binding NtrC family response regulator